MIYRFGDFELYEDGFCLTRDGLRISLEPKALSVLLVLVSRAGRLVEKRFLLETVWNSTFVEENTLTRTIGVLRCELGDSSKESRFIETIPPRGYRFIAPVETLPEHTTPQPAEPSATLPLSPPVATPQSIGETSIPQPTLARTNRPILAATAVILLYFSKETGTGSIWKMSTNGGPEQQLTDTLFRTNLAVTKSGIYFMTAPGVGDNSEVRFYSFATGATTTVVPIGLPEYGLAISPDGRYLIYDQLDDPASDLMLVENFH